MIGLEYIYYGVQGVRHDSILDLWEWMFYRSGATATGSYTAELKVLANVRVIFTADPENIKAILATQFEDYGKGPQFYLEWKEFLGDGIFNNDGRQWHESRQMIRPIFTRDRVGDLDIVETHVQKLIAYLGPGDGRAVRLDKLLSRFTLDAATHFLFGRSAGSLDEETNVFGDAFDEAQRIQGVTARAG